jgi:glycosyltransferase involved in cell wall biosynthesis
MPALSVVVTARDRAAAVRSLLSSLCQQTLPLRSFEVVLVDDGSSDDLAEVARELGSRLPLVYAWQRAAGRTSARLHGLYRARGQVILQLEPDDVAPPGLLQAHHAFHLARRDRNAGLVGPLLPTAELRSGRAALALWRADPLLARAARPRRAGPVDLRECWRARWSFKRAFVVELHGSHQGPITDGHDLELAVRLRNEGLKLEFSEAAACWSGERLDLAAALRQSFALGQAAARLAAARRGGPARLHPRARTGGHGAPRRGARGDRGRGRGDGGRGAGPDRVRALRTGRRL